MPDSPDARTQSTGGAVKRDPRQDRLKLALRENLKRRKSQARGRQEVQGEQEAQEITETAEPADAGRTERPAD